MFDLLRFARRVSQNPWVLVPVLGLIAVAVIVDLTLLAPGRGLLPDEENLRSATIAHGSPESPDKFHPVDMQQYFELRRCLSAYGSIDGPPTGELLATMLVEENDGSSVSVKLYADGVVESDGEFYKVYNPEKLTRLVKEAAPPPRPPGPPRRPKQRSRRRPARSPAQPERH